MRGFLFKEQKRGFREHARIQFSCPGSQRTIHEGRALSKEASGALLSLGGGVGPPPRKRGGKKNSFRASPTKNLHAGRGLAL